ncbi:MAG TPA: folylpolyglutamate synthase/dihydrofolate synthase family protein [Pyrinomonadaceae bacterium]|nr:folylpolyglutamate synthase/dihydrofolate synthase family protein [Pyrinomonadaceae bacterium]
MQFDEALSYLLSLGHETLTIKLGLRNTEILLAALGNPQQAFSSIQIAGTNGKGSTAAVLESILRRAGTGVGLYTSPHLISITERITIGGNEISRADFASIATEVRGASETIVKRKEIETLPTFFEQVTAIALLAFRQAEIELAILETGLGGRLDATTCALAHTVAITPVALDHEEYLGHTIEEIASEKAAIIRPGVAAVISQQLPPVRDVILRQCELKNVIPCFDENETMIETVSPDGRFCVTFKTPGDKYEGVWLGLRGRHQITNVSLAIAIAESLRKRGSEIPKEAIIEGIKNAKHPGRLELLDGAPSILLDGAHNPAGAKALRDYLDEFSRRPLTLVFGAMRDKKLEQMADLLFTVADQIVLWEVENPRAASLEVLQGLTRGRMDPLRIATARSAIEAIQVARERTPPSGMICFTGSLYLIGAARAALLAMETVAKSETGR